MVEKSKLSSLGYMNVIEMLGERFHASPNLLKALNPEAKFAAGEEIQVPNIAASVAPVGPPRGSQADPSNPATTTVTVRKSTSDLTVTDGAGHVLMYAPVTTGSEHDPLPIGDWKVTGVQKDPKFHYNPDLFWDAEPGHSKATLPAGPNNPVGVVWVDISRPHYGLHGTPEPQTIGKTASHGCVRLTNWDAQEARVARSSRNESGVRGMSPTIVRERGPIRHLVAAATVRLRPRRVRRRLARSHGGARPARRRSLRCPR